MTLIAYVTLCASVFIILLGSGIYLASASMLSLVFGCIFGYILHPLATRLTKILGLSRGVISFFMVLTFFTSVGVFFLILLPKLNQQIFALIQKMPEYLQTLILLADNILPVRALDTLMLDNMKNISNVLIVLSKHIWGSGKLLIDFLSFILIAPLISFYILRDWPLILQSSMNIISSKYHAIIQDFMSQIDVLLSGCFRGQLNISILMAVYYTTSFSLMGMESGILIGLLTGVLYIAPYIGVLIGLAISSLIIIVQFKSISALLILFSVFGLGHSVEFFYFTPKLLGKHALLHPIWVIISIVIGGNIWGITGMLLGIPLAGAIRVIYRINRKYATKTLQ